MKSVTSSSAGASDNHRSATRRIDLCLWVIALSVGVLATSCATADLCEQAADKVQECFGTELTECDETLAQTIVSQSCEEIVNGAGSMAKADCPSWLSWLCGDLQRPTCPAAGSADDYEYYTSEQRLNYHWEWMGCTEYGKGDNPEYATRFSSLLFDVIKGGVTSLFFLERSFTNSTDELDRGRVKMIHPYGTAAKVELVAAPFDRACPSDYTGMFTEESVTGLARLGWAASPKLLNGYIPGMAIKFFVEGQDSVNLQLIHKLDAEPDVPNFFSNPLTNVLPEPQSPVTKGLVKIFSLVADEPLRLSLAHLAKVYSDGTRIDEAYAWAPYRIEFRPTDGAHDLYESELAADASADFRDIFNRYPAGTTLYEVYAYEDEDSCASHIGSLETTSEFRAASWGDRNLQFQHATEGQGLD